MRTEKGPGPRADEAVMHAMKQQQQHTQDAARAAEGQPPEAAHTAEPHPVCEARAKGLGSYTLGWEEIFLNEEVFGLDQ